MESIQGRVVDVINEVIYGGILYFDEGVIVKIEPKEDVPDRYLLPGLIDAHVHIESSMLTPARFSELVVPRGTIAVVSDPHEMANVLGLEGVEFMIENAQTTPLKVFFGAPSCVPATRFETAGAQITSTDIEVLFSKGCLFLSEMMNYPGVLNHDPLVLEKLTLAKKHNLPVDGHAPSLKGSDLNQYIHAGITTDHECTTLAEALEKINLGMTIQIREGSAAKNFEALHSLIASHSSKTMLCTDDSHPDLISLHGHIDRLIRLGLQNGLTIFQLLRTAVLNPINHYNLPLGCLQVGDAADFIVVDDLENFNVLQTYINGTKVAEDNVALFGIEPIVPINRFSCDFVTSSQLQIVAPFQSPTIRVIETVGEQLLTKQFLWNTAFEKGAIIHPDTTNDLLKIVVYNRYSTAQPAVGFIKNFGLKHGAMASSVAHDSHNIVAVGCSDDELSLAINTLITHKGGICAVNTNGTHILPLPIAGIMSHENGREVAKSYMNLNVQVQLMGCQMKAPFMTLAFMPLLVIPSLKLSDQGLFDGDTFSFVSLFTDYEG